MVSARSSSRLVGRVLVAVVIVHLVLHAEFAALTNAIGSRFPAPLESSFSSSTTKTRFGNTAQLLVDAACVFRSLPDDASVVVSALDPYTPTFNVSDTCPSLTGEQVCCSEAQYTLLQGKMIISGIVFGECPACFQNVKELWCRFTCGRNQSDFVTAVKTHANTTANVTYVDTVNIKLSSDYASLMWSSCKDETVGAYPLDENWADVEVFLNYQAEMNTGMPKLEFDFNVPVEKGGFNCTVIPCSELCNCSNCEEACHFELPVQELVNNAPALEYWLLVGFLVGLFALISVVGVFNYRALRKEEDLKLDTVDDVDVEESIINSHFIRGKEDSMDDFVRR